MSSPITLEALRILDAIDRRGSFAAAADELHKVPSALSYTVSKLEEELRVVLFDRTRRKARLTPTGRMLLDQGRQILVATEELTARAREAEQGWETELRICIDSLLTPEPVYELIAQFHQIQPRTQIRLTEEVLGGSWDALNANRCDLVIGASGEPPAQGFKRHYLGVVEFVFAVAEHHPLCQKPQPLSLRDIEAWPTVIVADSSQDMPGQSIGLLDGRSRIIVPTMEYKIRAQIAGTGVGYLPRYRIQQALERGQLRQLLLAEQRSQPDISVAWRGSSKGKALQWFTDQLRHYQFDNQAGLRAC
ncbi:LysR family transcriptional regulator [Oceanospirillum sediminis]|uniref:LysR family transcriptional regulator n=1 Tax=Oceanospirillum sediminis TaxID=2760088 RepID=A0A839IPA9_9GAMM|nr:LysR family transcriptional regulator [Oceanospirillum sediminis]MBB1486352.1 LysR family transcriptional regulator [Oceanospirillum sediminis]